MLTYERVHVHTYVKTYVHMYERVSDGGWREDSCKGRCMCFSIYCSREGAAPGEVAPNDDGYSSNFHFRVCEGHIHSFGC